MLFSPNRLIEHGTGYEGPGSIEAAGGALLIAFRGAGERCVHRPDHFQVLNG